MVQIPREKLNQRQVMFEAITGTKNSAAAGQSGSVRGMLQGLYGTTRNGQPAVDTREAARRLKVSQRTVQRWLKNDNTPTTDHLKSIEKKSRQAVTTKRGRARAIRRAAATQPSTKEGIKVTVHGSQGPRGYIRDNRNATQKLTSQEHEGLLNAYAVGGDEAALNYLTGIYSGNYVDDWQFNQVTDFRMNGLSSTDRDDPRAL